MTTTTNGNGSLASEPRKLRMAVLGLGRMGLRHAVNVHELTPRAVLVAAADAYAPSLAKAAESLGPSVYLSSSYDEIIGRPDIEAVLIATETITHAALAIKAMNAGKHVLLEKPISVDVNDARPVCEAARAHPELKVVMGFVRRYDESYQYAYNQIKTGAIGHTYLVKSVTNDGYDPTGFFLNYAKVSGGIFVDAAIHDIDGARWLLDVANPAKLKNPKKQVTQVYASGTIVCYPPLAEYGDVDTANAIIDFENGTSCAINVCRTSAHGHDIYTEIYGLERKLNVNPLPALNKVEIRDRYGVRNEVTPSFLDRFREAFANEVRTFVAVVLDDLPSPVTVFDGFEASQIAAALAHSIKTRRPVLFDDDGEPILD